MKPRRPRRHLLPIYTKRKLTHMGRRREFMLIERVDSTVEKNEARFFWQREGEYVICERLAGAHCYNIWIRPGRKLIPFLFEGEKLPNRRKLKLHRSAV